MNLRDAGKIIEQVGARNVLPVPNEASAERVCCRERVVQLQGGVVAIVVSFTQKRVAGGISQKRFAAVAHSKIVDAFGTGNSRQKLLHCWIGGHSRGLEDVHFSHLSRDRKSTRLNSSHVSISYAVFC